jgi:hypothetical protein
LQASGKQTREQRMMSKKPEGKKQPTARSRKSKAASAPLDAAIEKKNPEPAKALVIAAQPTVPQRRPSSLSVVANGLARLRGSFIVLEIARQPGHEANLKSYRDGPNFPIHEWLPVQAYAPGIFPELAEVYGVPRATALQAEVTNLCAELLNWMNERDDVRRPEDEARLQTLYRRLEDAARDTASAAASLSQRRRLTAVGSDGSWVTAHGVMYTFTKQQQALVVSALATERERAGGRDGAGLREKQIGELIGSSSNTFRLQDVFKGHPSWKKLIRPVGKGAWALFLDS